MIRKATISQIKSNLSNFDDKSFFVKKIVSYQHDKNCYLIKKDKHSTKYWV